MKVERSVTAEQEITITVTWAEWVDVVSRLSFDGESVLEIGEVREITVSNAAGGSYSCWLGSGDGVRLKFKRLHRLR